MQEMIELKQELDKLMSSLTGVLAARDRTERSGRDY